MDVRGEEKSYIQSYPQLAMNHRLLKGRINASMSNGRCSMQSGEKKKERQRKMGKAEKERNNKNVRDEGRRKQFEGEDVRRG